MDHCVYCGRLIDFCGALNKNSECEDCEMDRLDNEIEDEDIPVDILIGAYNKSVGRISKM